VGLRAVAAVGLEGALRHLTRLLLKFFAVCNSPSVYPMRLAEPKETANQGVTQLRLRASFMHRIAA
jgi:hypothetical protein